MRRRHILGNDLTNFGIFVLGQIVKNLRLQVATRGKFSAHMGVIVARQFLGPIVRDGLFVEGFLAHFFLPFWDLPLLVFCGFFFFFGSLAI